MSDISYSGLYKSVDYVLFTCKICCKFNKFFQFTKHLVGLFLKKANKKGVLSMFGNQYKKRASESH